MANQKCTDVCGFNADSRETVPQFALGQVGHGHDASTGAPLKFIYVQANGAIAASQSDITVSAVGQASDGSGTFSNSAVAFADNDYGWVWDEVN